MKTGIVLFSLIVSFNLFAQGAPVPHIFDSGNPIVSTEFNANFQELSNRNSNTQSQATQNANDVSTNQNAISTIQGNITQIQNDITNLQTNTGTPLLQFVGISSGAVNGAQGVRAMTELCQVDFVDSRMCTSEEYVKTTSFPAGGALNIQSWIRPGQLVGSGSGGSGAWITDPFFRYYTCS